MSMKKLSNDIQSLFCASRKIRSYKRAVEELVFNSLDAESTSIAIRVNINDNTIQVVDNGCGVEKHDFKLLGQRYATSRCGDLSVLKSVPNKYGYQGLSLASIIEVSQTVKITSRCENKDETWMKTFYKGKENLFCATTQRPSKGTTVEIKGFLYNLNIQKKTVNALNELLDIKTFLEQISLVHSNISLSLRDDSKNEIILKLHKKRDIYQTLLSSFGIDRTDVQELKVEKNQNSVTAFIGKKENDKENMYWIYLNGKIVFNTKLHELVENFLIKSLGLTLKNIRKSKSKNTFNQEEHISNSIPFYFIFITCPYYDYDISYSTTKQSLVEFKNWEQITKLLEKLVKFYVGDHNLKEISMAIENPKENKMIENNTRHQVKKVMEKILGNQSKKPGVSQMQNGVKGKLIKRKHKKQNYIPKISLSKIIPPRNNDLDIPTRCHDISKLYTNINQDGDKQENIHEVNRVYEKLRNTIKSNRTPVKINNNETTTTKKNLNKERKPKNIKIRNLLINGEKIVKRIQQNTFRKTKPEPTMSVMFKKAKKCLSSVKTKTTKKVPKTDHNSSSKKTKKWKDPLINKFDNESSSVKQRCKLLANEVENLLSYKKKRKRRIFINETVQYSNVMRNNTNVSVRKQVGEIVVHDYLPLPRRYNPCSFDDRDWDGLEKKRYKSSYDLVQTIFKTQHLVSSTDEKSVNYIELSDTSYNSHYKEHSSDLGKMLISSLPRHTYESHNTYKTYKINQTITNHEKNSPQARKIKFITTQSRNNFIALKDKENLDKDFKMGYKKHSKYTPHPHKSTKFNEYSKAQNLFQNIQETSYTIEFTGSHERSVLRHEEKEIPTKNMELIDSQKSEEFPTYIISGDANNTFVANIHNFTYTQERSSSRECAINYRSQSSSSRENEICESHKTYTIHEVNNHIRPFTQKYHQDHIFPNNRDNNVIDNVVFISKSQNSANKSLEKGINPLDVCQTVHSNDVFEDLDLNERQWNDSLFSDDYEFNSILFDRNAYTKRNSSEFKRTNNYNELSHHFNVEPQVNENIFCKNNNIVSDLTSNVRNDNVHSHLNNGNQNKAEMVVETSIYGDNKHTRVNTNNNFNLKNRLRFVPKGMSPIFENCHSKNLDDYNLDKEYYENILYKKFANNVQINTEVFEPALQNLKELTTKDIDKVTNKLNKDNASLIFNGDSLKAADVLGQVDTKFIAAKIKGRSHQRSHRSQEFLVLFDQHAVHERIKLEENLSDYCNGKEWKTVVLDDITLKLSKDDTLYLHNYEGKLTQFGLRWKNMNKNEVLLCAIPEAILGKNPRPVEVVIKAVRNLIFEEINAIKSQSGCVSLYPKCIMDLVNSEACRYAIKFGDRLSKNECVELLKLLSECKTPFQCAHGRPVMAVLMDIKNEKRHYRVNLSKISEFIKKYVVK